ncbi:helix-turn-helix domain-containing protein [Hymenobacter sp. J193]|uniref:helix-turn-helix domain-containing protein n=1 Tax=Hymenobacter sp. J193 TaxID=2898429 RepID=UPI002150E4AA|nr:helix-turn-helix domain-containing protein [Hymenobacter sp. J193]MCR5886260.1 helix-turn-helix domain-containing protein [Hymenobacter sp. J193]
MFSAARILAIRKSKGFSQEMLAEQSGVSLRTIQRVEQGETVPRGHTLQALAAALGVSLADFRTEPEPLAAPVPVGASVASAPFTAAPEPPELLAGPGQALSRADEQALTSTLEPTPQTALVAASPEPVVTHYSPLRPDPEFLQLLNLSALSLLVLPLLNIIVPFVLWRRRRHTILHAAEVGRRVLGFQILWQVGCFFAYIVLMVGYQVAHALDLTLWRGGYLAVFIGSYLLNVLTVVYYAGRLRRGDLNIYGIRL